MVRALLVLVLAIALVPSSARAQFGPPGGKGALDRATDRTPEDPVKRKPWLENRIAALEKSISAMPDDSPAIADLLLKMADLHRQLADTCSTLSVIGAEAPNGLPEEKKKELKKCSSDHSKKAAQVLARSVKEHPRSAILDQTLFYLAWYRLLGRDSEGAAAAATRLLKEFPESVFASEAYLLLGEISFDKSDLVNAKAAYVKATEKQGKENKIRIYALYKLAWCDYNLSLLPESLEGFVKVAKAAGESEEWRHLRREALRDTVLVYATAGKPAKAVEFFLELAPKEADALLLYLAQHWLEQGKLEDCLKLCKALRQSFPDSPQILKKLEEVEAGARKMLP